MKPILDWYDQLPEPIRSQAIRNYDKVCECADDITDALENGFVPEDTPEGAEYWDDIWNKAASGEFDIKK